MRRVTIILGIVLLLLPMCTYAALGTGLTDFQMVTVDSDASWWGLVVRYESASASLHWTDSPQYGSGVLAVPASTDLWTAAYIYEPESDSYTCAMHVLSLSRRSLPVELVSVTSDTFTMGATDEGNDGTYADSDEYPRHQVSLDAYHIGRYPVTNAQFAEVLNWALGRGFLRNSDGDAYQGGDVYSNGKLLLDISASAVSYIGAFVPSRGQTTSARHNPVVGATWYGGAAFCNWLSEMEERSPAYDLSDWSLARLSGNGYRLPTEAEWECAAGWSGSRHWIYGYQDDAFDPKRMNSNASEPAGWKASTPVGYYDGANGTTDSPSPVGCYDMSGNVWEWCQDWYDEDYYGVSPQDNPSGPASGNYRVNRGGSYRNNPTDGRSANRNRDAPGYAYSNLGFRIVCPLP